MREAGGCREGEWVDIGRGNGWVLGGEWVAVGRESGWLSEGRVGGCREGEWRSVKNFPVYSSIVSRRGG